MYSISIDREPADYMPLNSVEYDPINYPLIIPVSNIVTEPTSTVY